LRPPPSLSPFPYTTLFRSLAISIKFSISRDGLVIEQGQFDAGTSHFDVQAAMANFAAPHWKYRYRGWTNLEDFRKILRAPLTPTGKVDLRGEGTFADGEWKT